MTYSLGTASYPNATWGTYYNDFGKIQSEDFNLEADISPFPLYGQSRDQTEVDDFGGATMHITLSIEKTGTAAEIASFATALLTLINGEQIPANNYPMLYVSDYLGSMYVKIESITGTITSGEATKIEYVIKLVQAVFGV